MELVKDIYFNTDKLVENSNVKVSYTGKFYQGDNDKVFLHYGYGKDWNNINEVEMTKTDLGYQAELNLIGNDTINFCFKNQNNEWDNNFGNNYIFNIEKKPDFVVGNDVVGNDFIENNFIGNINKIGLQFDSAFDKKNIENDNFKVITPSFDTVEIPKVENLINEEKLDTNINVIETNATPAENAIALAPTGFNFWTKKIKETVCKFFAYVPKLISGNYKRNLSKNNKH